MKTVQKTITRALVEYIKFYINKIFSLTRSLKIYFLINVNNQLIDSLQILIFNIKKILLITICLFKYFFLFFLIYLLTFISFLCELCICLYKSAFLSKFLILLLKKFDEIDFSKQQKILNIFKCSILKIFSSFYKLSIYIYNSAFLSHFFIFLLQKFDNINFQKLQNFNFLKKKIFIVLLIIVKSCISILLFNFFYIYKIIRLHIFSLRLNFIKSNNYTKNVKINFELLNKITLFLTLIKKFIVYYVDIVIDAYSYAKVYIIFYSELTKIDVFVYYIQNFFKRCINKFLNFFLKDISNKIYFFIYLEKMILKLKNSLITKVLSIIIKLKNFPFYLFTKLKNLIFLVITLISFFINLLINIYKILVKNFYLFIYILKIAPSVIKKKSTDFFWAYLEDLAKKNRGTVPELFENLRDIRDFIKNIFFYIYISIAAFIGELYRDWKKIRPEKLIFFMSILYIKWFSPRVLRLFKKLINYNTVFSSLKVTLKEKKITSYFILILLFCLFIKVIKCFLFPKIFLLKSFDISLLIFKSYKNKFLKFFFFNQRNLNPLQFYFKKKLIFKVRNRYFKRNRFKYLKNYFFKNKHWLVRNRYTRWYLRRMRISKVKYKFAEQIRKRIYMHPKKRRLMNLFFKLIPLKIILFCVDVLYNPEFLLYVIETLTKM